MHLLEAGTNLRVLQQLFGHERIQTTCAYTHISLEELREAFSVMDLLEAPIIDVVPAISPCTPRRPHFLTFALNVASYRLRLRRFAIAESFLKPG